VEIAQGIEQLLRSNQAMQTKLNEMGSRLQESQGQVDVLQHNLLDLQKTMLTDPLTGVGNRRFFGQLLDQAIERADRDVSAFLILIDLDGFKGINDKFGHDAGDQVLEFVATETCKLRSDFPLVRYGGDEFAIFMEATDLRKPMSSRVNSGITFPRRVCDFLEVRNCLEASVCRSELPDCAPMTIERQGSIGQTDCCTARKGVAVIVS
jgi:GGDEF domain-containing protein